MKLKRWFCGGRKIQDEIQKKKRFFELLRNMFYLQFWSNIFFSKRKQFCFQISSLAFWKMCSNLFLAKKTFNNHRPKKKFLKHLLLKLFCWGRREKSSSKSFSICSLSTFVLKNPFPSFLQMSFFLVFVSFFSFFLFCSSASYCCVFLFSKKKKDRIKWETAWCNGCPADQISDNWTYIDFTSSTNVTARDSDQESFQSRNAIFDARKNSW